MTDPVNINTLSFYYCFKQTLKACVTNMACAPFFLIAILFYAFYYCWPYQAQLPNHINSIIVDEDNSQLSQALSRALLASPHFHVLEVSHDREQAIRAMRQGKIYSIIGIPDQFELNILNNIPTDITLITNGAFIVVARSDLIGASGILEEAANAAITGHLYAAGVPLGSLAARILEKKPSISVQAMYNTISGYLSFAVSIVFVIIFQSIMMCGLCMLLNAWFLTTPFPPPLALAFGNAKYLFALQLPVCLISFVWIMAIEGAAFAWQGINSFQNIPATCMAAFFFSFALSALGLLIGMLLKTSRFAIHLIVSSSLACVFISGNLFPWQNIPFYMQILASLLPSTPGVDAILAASQAGADVLQIFPELIHLLLLGALYFNLAYFASRA